MKKAKNYLDYIPIINKEHKWNIDENGIVTITIINKGFFNRIAQIFFKAPKKSEIKLDEYGSMVWKCIDDKKNIGEIANEVRKNFDDNDSIFYERLIKFFYILKQNKFIKY
ncbi:PqqD family protein [Clostridium sp. cel8]|jgi:hypothetical protein|uniref:PqqD family protein n=1 Tax=unclassified Clostridium TaxID=2614128 RepID=UPI0015F4F712|nr:PqqD family protein [Clostridium sp. cel8]MBA5851641.1 PqqD family protein [Clostridium sp. cel8]